MDADGDFVVVWLSYFQDGSGYGVYAQRDNPRGPRSAVSSGSILTRPAIKQPRVAMDAAGDFVVAWASIGQDGSGYGVYAQRYNAAGVAQGGEFRVNTYTTDNQSEPRDGDGRGRRFRRRLARVASDGGSSASTPSATVPQGVPQGDRVPRQHLHDQPQPVPPAVAMDADGEFRRRLARATTRTAAATASMPSGTTPPACPRAASSGSTPTPPATRHPRRWRWTRTAISSSPGRAPARTAVNNGIYAQRYNAAGHPAGRRVPRQHLHHRPPD